MLLLGGCLKEPEEREVKKKKLSWIDYLWVRHYILHFLICVTDFL